MFNFHKLQQELVSILGLSIFQLWWNFNFPAVIRLGNFYALILSVTTTIAYVWLFTDGQRFRSIFELETFNDAPNAQLIKSLMRIAWLIVAHTALFYMWLTDYYHMHTLLYVIWYAHCFIAFVLFYRAVYR